MAEKAGLDVRQCSRGPEKRGYRVQAVDHGLVEMIKFRANVTNMESFFEDPVLCSRYSVHSQHPIWHVQNHRNAGAVHQPGELTLTATQRKRTNHGLVYANTPPQDDT